MSPVLSTFGGAGARGFGRAGLLGPTTAATSLSATQVGTSVQLSWTNTNATAQIRVYRGASLVTTLSAATTTYTNTGLSQGTSYSYTVAYFANGIQGPISNTATITTLNISITNITDDGYGTWTTNWSKSTTSNLYRIRFYVDNSEYTSTTNTSLTGNFQAGLGTCIGKTIRVDLCLISNNSVMATASMYYSAGIANGAFISGTDYCNGYTLYGSFSNGVCGGGTYTGVLENNSQACGYVPPSAYSCSEDGAWDDTLGRGNCCSGAACSGSTQCCNPSDYGNGWASCAHMCGSGCGYDHSFPGPYFYCSGGTLVGPIWPY
jgi:hypothetical protein